MSLLIIGSIAIDSIETPFGSIENTIGGSGSYLALAANIFYPNTYLISQVGYDFKQEFIETLVQKGINTQGLTVDPEAKTFHWKGKYHADLNHRESLITELNTLQDYLPTIPGSDSKPDFLILGNFHPEKQLHVLSQLTKRPQFIAMDTIDYWIENHGEKLDELFEKIDLLCINEEEARLITDEHMIKKAASKLLAKGIKYVIVKKGEHGALLFKEDEAFYAPGLPLEEVFDPTGAGDTFLGGLMGYLALEKEVSFESLKRALVHGSALASFCVEKFGTKNLLNLTTDQIEHRLHDFIDLVQFEIKLSNEKK
ncbi:PfkB family carbohydrate kinase [Cyclobacteriaceae bacterium]|nr:PfkB family carbohydrate kinase [Cyclobacteriaceae bacterium]